MTLLADKFTEKTAQWKKTAALIEKNVKAAGVGASLINAATLITECGDILNTYADLMQSAADTYEENEKKLIRALEE